MHRRKPPSEVDYSSEGSVYLDATELLDSDERKDLLFFVYLKNTKRIFL